MAKTSFRRIFAQVSALLIWNHKDFDPLCELVSDHHNVSISSLLSGSSPKMLIYRQFQGAPVAILPNGPLVFFYWSLDHSIYDPVHRDLGYDVENRFVGN